MSEKINQEKQDFVNNLQTMIDIDQEEIRNLIESNRFEIQKTNFMLTAFVATITFWTFDKIPSCIKLILFIWIAFWFIIIYQIFEGKILKWWSIDRKEWIEIADRRESLRSIWKNITEDKNEYVRLVKYRAEKNNILFMILWVVIFVIIMFKFFTIN